MTPSANWLMNQSVTTPESPELRTLNVKKHLGNIKPKPDQQTNMKVLPSSPLTKPNATDEQTPESPELKTMNLRKHLTKENQHPVSADAAQQEGEAGSVIDTPQMPKMSARKSKIILAASAKKSNRNNALEESYEERDSVETNAVSDSPGSPTPPRLRTLKL